MFDDSRAASSSIDDRAQTIAQLRRKLHALGAGPQPLHAVRDNAAQDNAAQDHAVQDNNGVSSDASSPGASRAAHIADRVSPEGGVLAVPTPLAAVLPYGGIPRGSVVTVGAAAAHGGVTSLLLSLLAAAHAGEGTAWIAVVGLPDFGVLAATEMGIDLNRLVLIPEPGPDLLQVLSVLADGVEVIVTAPPVRLPPGRGQILVGRLRQSGSVLLVRGRWPGADLAFSATEVRWSGLGAGYGRLRDRQIDIRVGGRRAGAGMGAHVTLALQAAQDRVIVQSGDVGERSDAAQYGGAAQYRDAIQGLPDVPLSG